MLAALLGGCFDSGKLDDKGGPVIERGFGGQPDLVSGEGGMYLEDSNGGRTYVEQRAAKH